MHTFILNTRTYDKLFNAVNIANYHNYSLQILLPHDITASANSPEEHECDYIIHARRKVASCVYALAEFRFENHSKWQEIMRANHIEEQELIIIAEDSGETKKAFQPMHFDFTGLNSRCIDTTKFPGPDFKAVVETLGGIRAYHERWLAYQKNTGEKYLDFLCESIVCGYKFDTVSLEVIWKSGTHYSSEKSRRAQRMQAIYDHIEVSCEIALASLETCAISRRDTIYGLTLEHVRAPTDLLERGETRSSFELSDYTVALSPRQAALRGIFDRFHIERNSAPQKLERSRSVRFFPDGIAYPRAKVEFMTQALSDQNISILPAPSRRLANYNYKVRDPAYYFGVDVYILLPPDTTNEITQNNLLAKAEYALQLCRIPNLKRIEPRNKDTITILYNPHNEWKPYLDFMYHLYDAGLSGNKPVIFRAHDDITMMRDHPFAFVVFDVDSIKKILSCIKPSSIRQVHRYLPAHDLLMPTHISSNYTAGVFAGHNVESSCYDAEGFIVGSGLAASGIDLVTGGGDRSIMGALERGFIYGRNKLRQTNIPYDPLPKLHGSITEFLLTVETTRQGFCREYDTTYIAPDMSHRKRFFWENCDDFGIIKGAHGAYEEFNEAFMLILNNDPMMKNKNIIVLDNPLGNDTSFSKLLTLYFGKEYWRHKDKLKEYGIRIVDSPKEMVHTFRQIAQEKKPMKTDRSHSLKTLLPGTERQ